MVVALVEVGLVVALFAGMLLHAGWLDRRRRRRGALLDSARDHLGQSAQSEEVTPSDVAAFRRLHVDEQLRVLAALSTSLSGAARRRVAELAGELGLLEAAGRRCSSRSWRRRLAGARWFTILGGGEAHVPSMLDDVHPDVRAQAVEWVADHPTPGRVSRVVRMLDDPSRWCRFTATNTILRLGDQAVDALAAHLPVARRPADALEAAALVAGPRLLEPVLALAGCAEPGIRRRALDVLAGIGGDRVATILEAGLADPDPGVRAASARGLGRLGRWSSSGRLGSLLDDPDWQVRRTAGRALADLGDPGVVVLRRLARSGRVPAETMARAVLEARSVSGTGQGDFA